MAQGQPWSQFGRSLGSNTTAVHIIGPTTGSGTFEEFLYVAQGREEIVRAIVLTNANVGESGGESWNLTVFNVTQSADLFSAPLNTATNPISSGQAYNMDPDQNRIAEEGDVLRWDCAPQGGNTSNPAFGSDTVLFLVTRRLE